MVKGSNTPITMTPARAAFLALRERANNISTVRQLLHVQSVLEGLCLERHCYNCLSGAFGRNTRNIEHSWTQSHLSLRCSLVIQCVPRISKKLPQSGHLTAAPTEVIGRRPRRTNEKL